MDSNNYETSRNLRIITLEKDILESNNAIAEQNRKTFLQHEIYVLNLISSPGSGKTSLLVKTLGELKKELRCAVIEGDQQTSNDALRIDEIGVPVVQINTNDGCHLNAAQVRNALEYLPLKQLDLLFIENVGNLVCPATFDLGENEKVVIMSITEGEDKPVKYPLVFNLARMMVMTKLDLLPHLRFDIALCRIYAKRVNPNIEILETSVYNEGGLEDWLRALRNLQTTHLWPHCVL